MSFLATVQQHLQRGIKDLLHARMKSVNVPHDHDILHASDLTGTPNFCPREFALLHLTNKQRRTQGIDPCRRYSFDYGFMVEDLVRNRYLRDCAWGNWKCSSCLSKRKGQSVPPSTCDRKGVQCQWVYRGIRVNNQDYRITCGLDLVVDMGAPHHRRIVEIKTIKDADFRTLKGPLGEHTLRTRIYLKIAELSGMGEQGIDTGRATILYCIKGHGIKQASGMSPFKEFTVVQNETHIEPYLTLASKLASFHRDGATPRGICPTSFVGRVKQCSVASECWSGKYPPMIKQVN